MKGTKEKGTREKRTKERESRERTRERDTHIAASWGLWNVKFQGGGRESNRSEKEGWRKRKGGGREGEIEGGKEVVRGEEEEKEEVEE
jgi:hypothetical protein